MIDFIISSNFWYAQNFKEAAIYKGSEAEREKYKISNYYWWRNFQQNKLKQDFEMLKQTAKPTVQLKRANKVVRSSNNARKRNSC